MNWLKRTLSFSALLLIMGCGVKGDPLPPEKPAELGRGRPTYKRATEDLKIRKTRHQGTGKEGDEADEDDKE